MSPVPARAAEPNFFELRSTGYVDMSKPPQTSGIGLAACVFDRPFCTYRLALAPGIRIALSTYTPNTGCGAVDSS
jgi:hypothetical protein